MRFLYDYLVVRAAAFYTMDIIAQSVEAHVTSINQLQLPDVLDYHDTHLSTSPVLTKYRLHAIKSDVLNLQRVLTNLPQSPQNSSLADRIDWVLNQLLDEKLYLVNRVIDSSKPVVASQTNEEVSTLSSAVAEPEDLNQLRQRLLSGGTSSKLDDAKVNEYHESVQVDLINELSDLTSSLKQGAFSLSQKILGDDLAILNETNDNLAKNSSRLQKIDQNLNRYLENKTGGKVGWIYMIKVAILVAVVLVLSLLMIALAPKF